MMEEKKKIKIFVSVIVGVILLFVCLNVFSQPTMEDAKKILSYNSMSYSYDDGIATAMIPLSDGTMFGNENTLVISKMEKKFGTPSHTELIQMCADARDYSSPKEKTFKKGNLEIEISTVPMKNSTLMIFVEIQESSK